MQSLIIHHHRQMSKSTQMVHIRRFPKSCETHCLWRNGQTVKAFPMLVLIIRDCPEEIRPRVGAAVILERFDQSLVRFKMPAGRLVDQRPPAVDQVDQVSEGGACMGSKRDLKVHIHIESFLSRGSAIRILRIFGIRTACSLCVWSGALRLPGNALFGNVLFRDAVRDRHFRLCAFRILDFF